MTTELNAALSDYLALVRRRFQTRRADTGLPQRFRLLLSDQQLLLRVVEPLETTREFDALVVAVVHDYHNGAAEQPVSGVWEAHVKNYLRLSGLYQLLFTGQKIRSDQVAEQCRASFRAKSHKLIHLAPLEFVGFSDNAVDCGAFTIRRFDREELDRLLGNRVKRVFYEWAYVDSAQLDGYWFVCVEEQIRAEEPGKIIWHFDPRVPVRYSPFRFPLLERIGYRTSQVFEEALENLALYDWAGAIKGQRGDHEKWPERWQGPFLPRVPFVISTSDSLIQWPARSPDLSVLEKEACTDAASGEECQVPRRYLSLGQDEAGSLKAFMQHLASVRTKIQTHSEGWGFPQTALGFLLKGFTTEGIEQLLWHITAIEAALGDRKPGLSKRLAARVSKIFGSEKDRRDQRQRFEALYTYRCDLVHGNAKLQDATITRSHLSEARDFARGAVLWALRYLSHVAENLAIGLQAVPSREDLLQVLDTDPEARRRLLYVSAALPPDFPHVEGWLKCE